MSDEIQSDPVEASSATQGPRLAFPTAVVIVHLAVTFGINTFGTTNLQNTIGLGIAPLAATLVLAVWWLASKGVPGRDRILGIALFLIAIAIVVGLHGMNGVYLLVLALPILTTGIVLEFLFTTKRPWATRRYVPAGFIALWVIGFGLVRVDAVGGDLIPLVSWRWSPTIEDAFSGSTKLASEMPPEPITLPTKSGALDWPEFRGVNRDGQTTSVTFATNWNDTPPKELWRIDIGLGWSSFTVIGDYLFTQEQRESGEFVVCYEANTGKQIWTNYVDARFAEPMGDGPRATPTFTDGKLFTQGATGILQCLDASTGEALWKRNVQDDTDARIPQWGFSSSPLVIDNKVIVFTGADAGKSVVAYDKNSGEIAWTSGDGNHGYCSGQLAEFDGVEQVLMISNFGLQSFLPDSGEKIWEHAWDLGTFARVTQPLLPGDGTVIIGSSFGNGSRKLNVTREGDTWSLTESWTTKKIRPYFNDCVIHDGYIYGYDGNRIASIDLETGNATWKSGRMGGQVLLIPEMDLLLSLTEKGDVVLIEAQPDAYVEVARVKALEGKTWNHPVIAQGKLFVRNSEEAVCYELPSL